MDEGVPGVRTALSACPLAAQHHAGALSQRHAKCRVAYLALCSLDKCSLESSGRIGQVRSCPQAASH